MPIHMWRMEEVMEAMAMKMETKLAILCTTQILVRNTITTILFILLVFDDVFKLARSARASRTRFLCFAVVVVIVVVIVVVM